MQGNNLAILIVLANSPEGRAEFDELERQLQTHAQVNETGSSIEQDVLDGIDLIDAGLAKVDGNSLQITDAGRSVVGALDELGDCSSSRAPASGSSPFKIIDNLIGAEERSRIFNLELRTETGAHLGSERQLTGEETCADLAPADRDVGHKSMPVESTFSNRDELGATAPGVSGSLPRASSAAPALLAQRSDATGSDPDDRAWRRRTSTALARHLRQLGALWGQHLQQDPPKARAPNRDTYLNGMMIALTSFLIIIFCAGAVIVSTQIRSLQMKLSSLQRELSPLKERLLRLDQTERANEAEKTQEERRHAAAKAAAQQPPLTLSREEVQLIRDYIKPAPSAGTSTTPGSIGDPITGPTIPFPSPITEKIPKLLGAKFAIRNGTILIVKRDSRQVDAVIGWN